MAYKMLEQKMKDAELENDVLKYQQAKAELKAREEQARFGNNRN